MRTGLLLEGGAMRCMYTEGVIDVFLENEIKMVTSRDNEIDELMSLNYGADQYVTKPYNIQILLAKITGLIKRNENSGRNSIYKRQWNRHKKRRNN